MKVLLLLAICLAATFANGQNNHDEKKKAVVIEALKKLFNDLNTAIQKHDRAALERIYADEFVFIHGFGFIDNKTAQVNGIMETDSVRTLPIPSFDQLYVYDNTAVLRLMTRNPIGGNNLMSTTVYAKKNGHWQIIQVQSTQQQRERKTITVKTTMLDSYAGKYTLANGSITTITRVGDSLLVQRMGQPKQPVAAVSETQFFDKFGSEITFYKDADGKLTHFIWRAQNGQELKWNKVE